MKFHNFHAYTKLNLLKMRNNLLFPESIFMLLHKPSRPPPLKLLRKFVNNIYPEAPLFPTLQIIELKKVSPVLTTEQFIKQKHTEEQLIHEMLKNML